jgi:hypothetical protein
MDFLQFDGFSWSDWIFLKVDPLCVADWNEPLMPIIQDALMNKRKNHLVMRSRLIRIIFVIHGQAFQLFVRIDETFGIFRFRCCERFIFNDPSFKIIRISGGRRETVRDNSRFLNFGDLSVFELETQSPVQQLFLIHPRSGGGLIRRVELNLEAKVSDLIAQMDRRGIRFFQGERQVFTSNDELLSACRVEIGKFEYDQDPMFENHERIGYFGGNLGPPVFPADGVDPSIRSANLQIFSPNPPTPSGYFSGSVGGDSQGNFGIVSDGTSISHSPFFSPASPTSDFKDNTPPPPVSHSPRSFPAQPRPVVRPLSNTPNRSPKPSTFDVEDEHSPSITHPEQDFRESSGNGGIPPSNPTSLLLSTPRQPNVDIQNCV